MALSDRHLIAAAVAVCAFIAVTKLPPESGRRNRRAHQTPEILVQNRAKDRLRTARAKLALIERRDSALALAARRPAPSHDSVRVVYGRDIPQGLRERLDSVLQRELAGIRTPLTAAPMVILFVTDTGSREADGLPAPSRSQWIDAEYVLPAATDGRTCVSIVRIGGAALNDRTRRNGRLLSEIALDETAGELLGPCGYIAAYGPPGPAVGRWLARSSYRVALRSPAPGTDSLRSSKPTFRGDRETIVEVILRRTGWSPQRDWLHPDVVACAGGDDGRCLAALDADDADSGMVRPPALIRSFGAPYDREAPAGRSRLMGAEVWLLASLHDGAGPEAFARFWTSALPVDSAWASATGTPLSTSARHWIDDTFEVGRPLRGPHPVALWLQLALAAGSVGGAIVLRQRRTVAA